MQLPTDRTFYNLTTQKKIKFLDRRILRLVNCEYPTDPLTILVLLNPSHDVPERNKMSWSPDLEALKLFKARSVNSSLETTVVAKPLENDKRSSTRRTFHNFDA